MERSSETIVAHYRLREQADRIEDRAMRLAIEQSVEMPLAGVRDPAILSDIVGKVRAIEARGDSLFDVTIALSARTVGDDADQLLNMLFGNASLLEDVTLEDAELPPSLLAAFGGPNHGLDRLRSLVGAERRAMICAALKPQGLSPEGLADLAFRLAAGGVDFIKDDHGLANQSYSPFEARMRACAAAARRANAATGRSACYLPSVWGSFEEMDRRLALVAQEGLVGVVVAPAVIGVANLVALKRRHPQLCFFAHPSLSGGRISPLLYARLFRAFGADAVIYPNYGGRFGYSAETCRRIADALTKPFGGAAPSAPAPGGGMTLARTPELLQFYGKDAILLVGGDLLLAPPSETTAVASALARAVESFPYG